jgi:hypothetical protein
VKPNESDVTTEPQPRENDLPELAVRIVSDVERIVTAEASLLEANIIRATQVLLDRLYVESLLIGMAAIGAIALVIGFAFLLHQWMQWWQALLLLGVCVIAAAEILRRSLIPSTAIDATRAVTEPRR